tara:strand:+ start:35 stop:712 length:678 start_codon:yes stop_codon:yes gene_type:complete
MTYRQIINGILIRLREETIPLDWSGNINDNATITDYQKVIGSLVNDAKRNIESYHDWLVLRDTKEIDTVIGQKNYGLEIGQEFKIVDVINQNTGQHLNQVSKVYINTVRYPSDDTGEPLYYAFNGTNSTNFTTNLKVDLSPIPTEVHKISFDFVKPQDELTLSLEQLKIPTQPVLLAAWARAIAERGEDGGTQSSVMAQEAKDALNQAIIIDSGNTQYEQDWYIR